MERATVIVTTAARSVTRYNNIMFYLSKHNFIKYDTIQSSHIREKFNPVGQFRILRVVFCNK